MRFIWQFLSRYKLESVIAPLFKCLEAVFELCVPLVISQIIDVAIVNRDSDEVVRMTLILLVLAVVGLACSLLAQYYAARAAVGLASKMRADLFVKIQRFNFQQLDKLGSSTLITRLTSDINQIQNGVNLTLRLFMRSPIVVFGAMIMAFAIDRKLSLIFLLSIILLVIIVYGIMFITKPGYTKVQEYLDKILGRVRNNLRGVRVIRAFNMQNIEYQGFKEDNDSWLDIQKKVGKISALLNPLTLVVVNTAIVFLIWYGAIRVDAGLLTQGQVVALVNYMSQILVELIKLSNLIITISKTLACAGRVEGVMLEETVDENSKIEKNNYVANDKIKGKEKGNIIVEFDNCSFRYMGAGANSLTKINFKVKRGETVGIIGGTGSGKSTLVNLIAGFYSPTEGRLYINGREIGEFSREDLLKNVAIVMQKAELYSGTVEDNLRMGNVTLEKEDLIRAVKKSCAYEFLKEKAEKSGCEILDLPVMAGGGNFSGGQKQRISIARALLKKSDILILDDSTSALDAITTCKVCENILLSLNTPTLFMVSQKVTSIVNADKIIVLEDGEIVAIGKHSELIDKCSVYREIYESQYGKNREEI